MRILLLFVLGTLLVAMSAGAAERGRAKADGTFWTEKDEGWHFYATPPPEPEPPVPPPPPTGGAENPDASAPTFSTAWLRHNLPKLQDAAMDDPSQDNVRLFLYAQQLAMDRAAAFAQATKDVIDLNPALNAETRTPTTTFARNAVRKEAQHMIDSVMDRLREKVGLFYFFRSDCPYCLKQNAPLSFFTERHRLTVLPVSIDGLPMPDGSHPEFLIDGGHSQAMGVVATPTFVLAVPETGEKVKLAEGLQTLSQLEDKLIETARRRGWITQTEYDAIKGTINRRLLDELPKDVDARDPKVLLAMLDAAGAVSGGKTVLGANPIPSAPGQPQP